MMPGSRLVSAFRLHGRKSALFIALDWPARVSPRTALCPCALRRCSMVILGPSVAAGPALASVSLPESHQPKLLKERDEAVQNTVDPVNQPKIDADSLQGGEGK